MDFLRLSDAEYEKGKEIELFRAYSPSAYEYHRNYGLAGVCMWKLTSDKPAFKFRTRAYGEDGVPENAHFKADVTVSAYGKANCTLTVSPAGHPNIRTTLHFTIETEQVPDAPTSISYGRSQFPMDMGAEQDQVQLGIAKIGPSGNISNVPEPFTLESTQAQFAQHVQVTGGGADGNFTLICSTKGTYTFFVEYQPYADRPYRVSSKKLSLIVLDNVQSIVLAPPEEDWEPLVNEVMSLEATVIPDRLGGAKKVWKSSDKSIAIVNANGIV